MHFKLIICMYRCLNTLVSNGHVNDILTHAFRQIEALLVYLIGLVLYLSGLHKQNGH